MGECSIPDCTKPARGTMCSAHLERRRVTGDVQAAKPIERRIPTGGPCPVPDCGGTVSAGGLCAVHYQRNRKYGDPTTVISRAKPLLASVLYGSAHRRVHRWRGIAKLHACVDCGAQAAHWSYREQSAGQCIVDENGRRYSLDPDDYEPRCTFCHAAFDAEARRRK